MSDRQIRRRLCAVLIFVIFFTILAGAFGQWAVVRGLWLAMLWQGASVACLTMGAQLLRQPPSTRRAWQLAGVASLKFPALYAAGFALLRWLKPSALGLAAGLTLPWLVFAIFAIAQLRASLNVSSTIQST